MAALDLIRDVFTDLSTTGRLYVNGVFECYTLEDPVRSGPKIAGKTAIPAGIYDVQITPSKRFKKPLPLLLNVPGFEGVRIHTGNRPEDTDGCILVGVGRTKDKIQGSQLAFDTLFPKIQEASRLSILISRSLG